MLNSGPLKKMRSQELLRVAIGLLVAGAACGHGRNAAQQPIAEIAIEPEEQLGVDDVFEVRVVDAAECTGLYRVASDGTIDFPYVGRLMVVNMRSGDVQRDIGDRLKKDKILVSPQVTVMVREWNSRKISVLGQVNKPGSVSYFPRMTIIDAIAAAGGFSPIAAKNNVTLRREVKGHVGSKSYRVADISEGLAGNVSLLPGDVLVVDERLF